MFKTYYLQYEDETSQEAIDSGGYKTVEEAERIGYSAEPRKAFLIFHLKMVMDRIEDRERLVDFKGADL